MDDVRERTASLALHVRKLRRVAVALIVVDALIAAAWLAHARWVRLVLE